mgnify:CR=1 FL=1
MKVEVGKIYNSKKCGEFIVLEKDKYINTHLYYKIKFLKTNYTTSCRYDCIVSGNIKDPYYPSYSNIGYIGGIFETHNYNDYKYELNRWVKILARCYDKNNPAYKNYGGSGVAVCKRWHNFTNYFNDIKYIPGYEIMMNDKNNIYHLDKDILQSNIPHNKRIYSPETCMFVRQADNNYQSAIDNFNNRNNLYFNVIKCHGNSYRVEIRSHGIDYRIGRYKDPIIAANAANHARKILGLGILNDNIPYYSQEYVNSNNLRKLPDMVKIIQ